MFCSDVRFEISFSTLIQYSRINVEHRTTLCLRLGSSVNPGQRSSLFLPGYLTEKRKGFIKFQTLKENPRFEIEKKKKLKTDSFRDVERTTDHHGGTHSPPRVALADVTPTTQFGVAADTAGPVAKRTTPKHRRMQWRCEWHYHRTLSEWEGLVQLSSSIR